MRVLLLIDALGVGGAETHVITLANALARAGDEVTVISAGGLLEARLSPSVTRVRFPCGVRSLRGMAAAWLALRRLLRSTRFDVLHAHTRRCALLLALLPRLPSRRCTEQVLRGGCYRRRGIRRALRPLRVVSVHAAFAPHPRRLCYWGELTVAVSEDLRRHLQDTFGCCPARHPIAVVGNGMETTPPPDRRQRGCFCVAFASRLEADCSLAGEVLLRISPRLARACAERGRELRVVVIGGGGQLARLQQVRDVLVSSGAPGEGTVTFTGALSDLRGELSRADVLVGVSRCALEGVICGASVVLAGNEGYGGVLTVGNFDHHAAGNFCCRGERAVSEEALLHDLLSLLQGQTADERAALQARVRRQLDVDVIAGRLRRLYATTLSARRHLTVATLGYFGRGNLGDQAILRALAARLEGACAPLSLAAATWGSSAATVGLGQARGRVMRVRRGGLYTARRQLFWGRGACGSSLPVFSPRCVSAPPLRLRLVVIAAGSLGDDCHLACVGRQVWTLWRLLWRADALLLGGGSLLQDASRHGGRSLLWYLGVMVAAMALGCPVSLRAGGIGPLRRRLSRVAVGWVLRRAAGISLRDARSVALARACGVREERLEYLEDGVLARMRRWGGVNAAGGGGLCVCPRRSDAATRARLEQWIRAHAGGEAVLFLAMDAREDAALCRSLAERFGGLWRVARHEREVWALLGRARVVIAMRYHAAILALGGKARLLPLPTAASADKLAEDFEKYRKNF